MYDETRDRIHRWLISSTCPAAKPKRTDGRNAMHIVIPVFVLTGETGVATLPMKPCGVCGESKDALEFITKSRFGEVARRWHFIGGPTCWKCSPESLYDYSFPLVDGLLRMSFEGFVNSRGEPFMWYDRNKDTTAVWRPMDTMEFRWMNRPRADREPAVVYGQPKSGRKNGE